MSFNPQTPQSPSQFSPSTADHSHSVNSSMASSATTLPTPAHSINGTSASDHHDGIMIDDYTSKRKRTDHDSGLMGKKAYLEDPRNLGIKDLHLDVGEKYLLCRTPHTVAYPSMCDDLFEIFNLTGIAADYARVKPNGEKNALRKTYKGQIKQLGVNGHFDSTRKEVDDPLGFFAMINLPETEWHAFSVQGKEIEKGFSETILQSALGRATLMAKGPIPKAVWDSAVLGDLAPSNVQKKPAPKAPTTPATSALPTVKSGSMDAAQIERLRRNGKKRSYQDSSFEGYSESFQNEEGGYSTGGDDRSNILKRRKKV